MAMICKLCTICYFIVFYITPFALRSFCGCRLSGILDLHCVTHPTEFSSIVSDKATLMCTTCP